MARPFPFLISSLLTLGLAALPAKASEVVLYSSNNVEAINTVVTEFNKKHPDIKVSVVRAGSGTLMQRIKAEAANPRADIFWSGGFSTIGVFRDLFQPYESPEAKAVAPAFRGPDNLWLGTNVHVMVMMVNQRALKGDATPKTWSDLADPKWKGRVVIADPERSSASYATLWGIHDSLGKEVLTKIAGNSVVVGTTSGVYEGVAKGEFAVGLTMEYAAQEYVAGGQKEIQIIYPSEGTFLSPEGMVIVKGAKNAEQAKKLYDMLASKPMQETLVKTFFRRPIREDIEVSKVAGMQPISGIKAKPIDDARATADQPKFIAMWKEIVANRK
jgi:iron(III) transport system substrate-binding protein